MRTCFRVLKRLLIIALAVFNVLLFSGCSILLTSLGRMDDDEKPFDYLNDCFLRDFAVIVSAVKNEQYDDAISLSWIKSADADGGYVDFYCGGSGFGSQTNYTGFFFTPDDDPLAMWRKSGPDLTSCFVETKDGWEYREHDHNPGGDNVFIVKKLAPCYYYYYLHY